MGKTKIFITLMLFASLTACSTQNTTQTQPEATTQTQATTQTSDGTGRELKAENHDLLQIKKDFSKQKNTLKQQNVFEIKDKMFITQCNDIYINTNDYLEKTIKFEGIYNEYIDYSQNVEGITYSSVIRNGPGCCGNDGVAGFEVLFDGEKPKTNDWVEAVGKVEFVEQAGVKVVVLKLSSLKVLSKRGQEFVKN